MSHERDTTATTLAAARELLARLSAAGALVVALVSLLQHAPAWIACARGVATLFGLGYGTRLGLWALAKALAFDRAARLSKDEGKP